MGWEEGLLRGHRQERGLGSGGLGDQQVQGEEDDRRGGGGESKAEKGKEGGRVGCCGDVASPP